MTGRRPADPKPVPDRTPQAEAARLQREARLAAALRANLQRRKAQARARADADETETAIESATPTGQG